MEVLVITWQSVCFAAEWASKCISTWGIVKTVMYRNWKYRIENGQKSEVIYIVIIQYIMPALKIVCLDVIFDFS